MDGINSVPSEAKAYVVHQGDNTIKATIQQPTKPDQNGDVPTPMPMDTVAITQTLAAVSGGLKPGEKVSIQVGKDQVATITKEGPDNWDRMGRAVKNFGIKAMEVSKDAIETDPSFVFRETVEMAKEPLTQMAPEGIKELSLKGLYPGVRAGVLFLDIRKAWKTLKNPKSSMADKVVDVGHCVTDVGGLIGAAAPLVGLVIPGATIFIAAAIVGDIIAFAYHTLMFALNQGNLGPAKNKKQVEQNQPQPAPAPVQNLPEKDKVKTENKT